MSKSILISIKPKYVALEMNGIKKIEVRNTAPKDWKDYLSGKTKEMPKPIDVYIYCTNDKNDFVKLSMGGVGYKTPNFKQDYPKLVKWIGNGKVVAKFTLNKVEEIGGDSIYRTVRAHYLLRNMCLKENELFDYLNGQIGYAWNISNLVIFDKPKELSEFKPYVRDKCMTSKCHFQKDYMCELECNLGLTKAPQSWCYIESEEQR